MPFIHTCPHNAHVIFAALSRGEAARMDETNPCPRLI